MILRHVRLISQDMATSRDEATGVLSLNCGKVPGVPAADKKDAISQVLTFVQNDVDFVCAQELPYTNHT